MIRLYPAVEQPENLQVKIWRYMDFTKFIAMLEKAGLFFSRADLFGEPFEGSYPKRNVDLRRHMLERALPGKAEEASIAVSDSMRDARKSMFVNCWHMNEHESAAMWKLYTRTNESICVQATYQRLHDCLEGDTCEATIGIVKYIDYNKELMPDELNECAAL